VFPWSGRQKVLRKLFVSSENARFYLMCRQPNLHELAQKFDARNLRKKLVQVSCASFLTVCHHHYQSSLYKNLHELARKFDARNLHNELVQVSCACFLTVCHHRYTCIQH